MDDLLAKAIESVKKLLISYLHEDNYCQARRVGDALKILVESKDITTATRPQSEGGSCRPERY